MIKRGMGEDSAGEGCMFCGSVPLSLSSEGGGGGGGGGGGDVPALQWTWWPYKSLTKAKTYSHFIWNVST